MTYKEKDETPLRAAIYVRVSTLDQKVEGHGIDVQIRNCLHYIDRSGYVLSGKYKHKKGDKKDARENSKYIYRDEDVSGTTDFENRPGAKRMLNDLKYSGEEKPFDILVIRKIDRFARSIVVLYDTVEELKKYDVTFASSTEHFDMGTPFGRMAFGILGLFAAFEREVIQSRTSEGTMEAKSEGMIASNVYGYKKDDKKRPIEYKREADIIRKIFRLYTIEGKNITEISRLFKKEKVMIPSISEIEKDKLKDKKSEAKLQRTKHVYNRTDSTLRKMLKNEFYIGKYYFNKPSQNQAETTKKQNIKHKNYVEGKGILSDFSPPAIVSPDIFKLAQEKRQKKKQTHQTRKDFDSKYLLSGLLVCDYCKNLRKKRDGDMLNRHGKPAGGKGKPIYQCRGKASDRYSPNERCIVLPLNVESLEKLVLLHIKNILANPYGIKKLIENQEYIKNIKESYRKELEILDSKLEMNNRKQENNIAAFIELAIISKKECKTMEDKLLIEAGQLNREKRKLDKQIDGSLNLTGYTEGLETLKTLLDKNIETIFENQEQAKVLLDYLIERIIIYSKKVPANINLPGVRKKDGVSQAMPYRIEIHFKLPQDFMNEFLSPMNNGPIDNPDGIDETSKPNSKTNTKNKKAGNNWDNHLHTKNCGSPFIIKLVIPNVVPIQIGVDRPTKFPIGDFFLSKIFLVKSQEHNIIGSIFHSLSTHPKYHEFSFQNDIFLQTVQTLRHLDVQALRLCSWTPRRKTISYPH